MYLAGILRKLTEVGFIQWRNYRGEGVYGASIGVFSVFVYMEEEKVPGFFGKKRKIYYILKVHNKGNEQKEYKEDFEEICSPANIMNLFYAAKRSAEEIPTDDVAKALVQEMSKEFGLRL